MRFKSQLFSISQAIQTTHSWPTLEADIVTLTITMWVKLMYFITCETFPCVITVSGPN